MRIAVVKRYRYKKRITDAIYTIKGRNINPWRNHTELITFYFLLITSQKSRMVFGPGKSEEVRSNK